MDPDNIDSQQCPNRQERLVELDGQHERESLSLFIVQHQRNIPAQANTGLWSEECVLMSF